MSESIQQAANRANPNSIADLLRKLGFGDVLRALPTFVRKSATAVSVFAGPDPAVSAQDQRAPALSILGAYARAGAGVVGPLTPAAFPPIAGQVAIAPNGQIVTALADAWTSVDVEYTADKGDQIEVTLSVAAGVLTLPQNVLSAGAIRLLEAEALIGGSTGQKFCAAIGAAPAAGQAALDAALTVVNFNAGDAVTKARVKLLVCSAIDVNTLLPSEDTSIL